MITRITKENAHKYRELFADAVYALQNHDEDGNPIVESGKQPVIPIQMTFTPEPDLSEETYVDGFHYIKVGEDWVLTEIGEPFKPGQEYATGIESSEAITTLEEYFCYIKYLYYIKEIGKRFTVLPLESDENFFEIDANTRMIKVPDTFVKNGISVQGDEIAEILYFKVDRFFDMTDLGEKDVYIEWRLPPDENGERKQGVSVPYFIDTGIEPGYVVIGWPLRSELTKIPGKIEFAVRFYSIPEDGPYANRIMYSLSTLTASAEIKPTLNLDLVKISLDGSALNSEDIIGTRLENSVSKDDNTPDPKAPEFIEENILPKGFIKLENEEEAPYDTYKVFLTNKENGVESDGLFAVQAKVIDGGRLSYTWVKRDEKQEVVLDYDGGKSSVFAEIATGLTLDADKTYYSEPDERGNYPELTFAEAEAIYGEGGKIYERKAEIVLNCSGKNVLGTYQARATNRLGRKTARAFSSVILVEGPEAPEITKDIVSGEETLVFDEKDYAIEVEVKANVDEHAYNTYKLFRVLADGDELLQTNKSGKFTIQGKAYNAEDAEADLGDGEYYIVVYSLLNSVELSEAGVPYRVTLPAAPVTITNIKPTLEEFGGYDINKEIAVTVALHPSEEGKRDAEKDTIAYQWYKYVEPNQAQFEEDIKNATAGVYVKSVIDEPIEGATGSKVLLPQTEANENGFYYCEVTNKYNGSERKVCSNFFYIVDTQASE